ncbi:MAG: FAD-dependent oxidoreductase [Pseudomonadota bacterium]
MTRSFPTLFSPIFINTLEIKNRIAYPALGLVYSYDRKLNDRYLNFYRARARGGAGIVTVGPVGVDFRGSGIGFLSLAGDEFMESFKNLARAIRDEGARSWVQLFHAGAYAHPFLLDGQQPMAPSGVYSRYSRTTPEAMTLENIEGVIQAFATAAARVKETGFDGVEIIGSAGYLICQFLSPRTNQRTDAYGGSLENRLRFPVQVIQSVRKAVGKDFPVTIRMAGNDFMDQSNTSRETPAIAKAYELGGIDAINVTGGWHETRVPQLPSVLPGSGFAYLAMNIKRAVSVPVMASNRISTPQAAEKILVDGCADMVNLGRVLLADPDWPNKAAQGRADEIRPCVACSQGCTDEVFSGRPVFCIGNPTTGFEGERIVSPCPESKHVLVAGAGPAGLEAAVTAAQRGHRVEIHEASSDLGGQIPLAAAPPHKHDFLEYMRYYRTMISRLGIELVPNSRVTPELIRQKHPDFVVVATGARPTLPPIDGIDGPGVISAWDLLRSDGFLGKRVAVVGGGAVGLETAMFAATKGTLAPDVLHFLFSYEAESQDRLREMMFNGSCKVTVFEMLDSVGKDVGKSTRWVLMDNLRRYGVEIITQARITSVKGGIVRYTTKGENLEMPVDTVVVAAGSAPENSLARDLENSGIPFAAVGDCTVPGNMGNAIHGGFITAMNL